MVCSVCGHRTKRADHLRQHVRKKHPEIAMRSLFRRPSNAHIDSDNHGLINQRLHSTIQHMQMLQRPLSYSTDTQAQLQKPPFRTDSTTATALTFMGVEVVDLDTEGDNDNGDGEGEGDGDEKFDSDKIDTESDNVSLQSVGDLGVKNVAGNNAYHQRTRQDLYQFRN
uniref:C2H2-type domain-containing protein n=1 Tax=Ceratitis capitata TaxID=7213 RepID=W8CCK0_CERCA